MPPVLRQRLTQNLEGVEWHARSGGKLAAEEPGTGKSPGYTDFQAGSLPVHHVQARAPRRVTGGEGSLHGHRPHSIDRGFLLGDARRGLCVRNVALGRISRWQTADRPPHAPPPRRPPRPGPRTDQGRRRLRPARRRSQPGPPERARGCLPERRLGSQRRLITRNGRPVSPHPSVTALQQPSRGPRQSQRKRRAAIRGRPGDIRTLRSARDRTHETADKHQAPRTGARPGSVQAPSSSLSIRLPTLVVWLSFGLRGPGAVLGRVPW